MRKKISIVLGGLLAIAMLFGAASVTTAYAQDETPATPVAGQERDGHGHGGRGMGETELAAAAKVLGMTADEVSAALAEGKTLEDLATTAGVDIQDGHGRMAWQLPKPIAGHAACTPQGSDDFNKSVLDPRWQMAKPSKI